MKRLLLLLAASLLASNIHAQSDLQSTLLLDPAVRTGQLSNGMRYYIRKNSRPEKRAEFRLAVNAGSTAENDDQQGLAHLVEHMAFNGTKNFKKSEIVDYLESVGTKFGAHLNAYTSFDETVYMLQLPTDKEEIVNKGLQILEDWAHNLSFDSVEVEKERGVVVEEWRLGQGADERMRREYWPVLFRDSRYQNRLPIGKKEIIQGCKQSTLRNFYFDWYRPDLMAVIAVGDFDVDAMEAKIKAQFSSIPVKDNERKLQVWPVPDEPKLAVSTVTDKEAMYAEIELIYKQPVEVEKTVGDYRRVMAEQLFSGMISARLSELQRQADPPFMYAGSDYSNLVRNKDAYMSIAVSKEDGITRALETIVAENERVRRYGFTATELQRQKADMMSRIEKLYNERNKTESRNFATEYVSNFLKQEPAPGIDVEYSIYKNFLSGITLDEVNAFSKQWITDGANCVVIITAPDKPTLHMPSDQVIRDIVGGMQKLDVKPYEDKVIAKPLVDIKAIKAGAVVNATTNKNLGITEWKLSNGARVILKPTDFKNEVGFTSYSWGGWSLYNEKDFMSAASCDEIVDESGLGEFDATALGKALSGKIVSCSPYVSELQQGMRGSCAPVDLETMFQLIHKSFTEPRLDEAAFESYMAKKTAALQNRGSDPQSVYMDTMSYAMRGYNSRFSPMTVDRLKEIDLNKSLQIYKERFADASSFTFVFVGNFNTDSIRHYAEMYIASLPATTKNQRWVDINASYPKGNFERLVYKGSEPRSTVMMRFNMPFEFNRVNRNEVSSLTKLLSIRLREVLREEKSGVYGVSCYANPSHYPKQNLELIINYSCSPENVEMLTRASLDVIQEVKDKGCDEKNLVKIKETALRERETSLMENQFWMNTINSNDQNGENIDDISHYAEWVNAMKADDFKRFAAKYLQSDNYARFVLLPEKK